MITWLKQILGIAPAAPISTPVPVTPAPVVKEVKPAEVVPTTVTPKKEAAKKAPAKKSAPKKAEEKIEIDLGSMKKGDLLAHAKAAGAKANASMKKEEIIAAIKGA